MQKTLLQIKYEAWISAPYISDRSLSCCFGSHFIGDDSTPLPDNMVCDRELAWRQYVRVRDNDPNFTGFRETLVGRNDGILRLK